MGDLRCVSQGVREHRHATVSMSVVRWRICIGWCRVEDRFTTRRRVRRKVPSVTVSMSERNKSQNRHFLLPVDIATWRHFLLPVNITTCKLFLLPVNITTQSHFLLPVNITTWSHFLLPVNITTWSHFLLPVDITTRGTSCFL